MKRAIGLSLVFLASGCSAPFAANPRIGERVVPAKEYTKAVHEGRAADFSILDSALTDEQAGASGEAAKILASKEAQARAQFGQVASVAAAIPLQKVDGTTEVQELEYRGDQKYLRDGFALRQSFAAETEADGTATMVAPTNVERSTPQARLPLGSSAPYYLGQMTSNPSLWPDEAQGASLFRDTRAFLPMDVVTIVINEKSEGRKKAETDSETKFSILAAIENFFGKESRWESNNAGLDAANMLNATTNTKFEGDGETKREGTLKARISAVVLEVLPNSLLRVEGTKIISVDHEEEVMVISGLVRPRDIDAMNEIDSSRIANMRIDFYGRGILADSTSPGWGVKIFKAIWPF